MSNELFNTLKDIMMYRPTSPCRDCGEYEILNSDGRCILCELRMADKLREEE